VFGNFGAARWKKENLRSRNLFPKPSILRKLASFSSNTPGLRNASAAVDNLWINLLPPARRWRVFVPSQKPKGRRVVSEIAHHRTGETISLMDVPPERITGEKEQGQMLKSAYIDPKRIERVEAVAEMIWRGFYDLGMGPRLIAEATVVALIKFVANEAVGNFPGEMNRLRKLLEEQSDALVEAASAG